MKRKKDPGLIYLNELKMNWHRTYKAGMNYLISQIGSEKVSELELWAGKRDYDNTTDEEIGFYNFKNQSLSMSLAISEVFDSDYIRKICNWISDNKELFGQKILDIGCDCGIVTCFIAKCFPEAEVVGIDRSKNAIKCAKELAERFGLQNASFIHSELTSFNGSFDTILFARVTQENVTEKDFFKFNTFFNISEFYKKQIEMIIGQASSLLDKEGILVSFEMMDLNPLYYAIIRGFSENTCMVLDSEEFIYKQFEGTVLLRCTVFNKAVYEGIKESSHIRQEMNITVKNQLLVPYLSSISEILARLTFNKMLDAKITKGAPQYFDWEANYMLDETADELIEGYFVYTDIQPKPLLYSLWTNINDKTALIYFGVPNDEAYNEHFTEWSNNDISYKDRIIEMIHKLMRNFIIEGHVVKITKAIYEDNHFIENDLPLQTIMKEDLESDRWNPLQSVSDIAKYLKK